MKKHVNGQKGFTPLVIVLIVVVVGIACGAGYYVWQKNNNIKETESRPGLVASATPTPTKVDETASWKTYTADKYNMSFKYPGTWSTHPIYNDILKYNQSVDIQNENGIVVAELNLAALGVGGLCPDDSALVNTTFGVEKANVKGKNTVFFSSMVINNKDGTYSVRYGLSDIYTKNGKNQNGCIFAFNFEVQDSYVAFADGYPGAKTTRKFNSNDEAIQYINNNSEYKDIKKMILSLDN
jgi:hypothetical protein